MTSAPQYGFCKTGERQLTAEEGAALRRQARRMKAGGCALGCFTPIGFLAVMCAFSILISDYGGQDYVFPVISIAGIVLVSVCWLLANDRVKRASALRTEARGGRVVRYEGTLTRGLPITSVQRDLLERGLLAQDGTVVQSVEILERSGFVYRVNGAQPDRAYWEEGMPNPWWAHAPAAPPDEDLLEEDGADGDATDGEGEEPIGAGTVTLEWHPPSRWEFAWWQAKRWLWFLAWRTFMAVLVRDCFAPMGPRTLSPALGVSLMVAASIPLIGIHEAGHVLAGRLMGFRLLRCRVGPLAFTWRNRRLRMTWCGFDDPGSGVTILVPDSEERFPWRHGWATAGGPLASLAITVALAVAAHPAWWPEGPGPWPREALALLAAFSGAHVLLLFVRMSPGPWAPDSDIRQLRALKHDRAGISQSAAWMILLGRQVGGQRPRDWDPGLLERICIDPWGTPDPEGIRCLFYHALDRGEVDRAEAILVDGLDRTGAGLLHTEMAFFQALYRGDAASAREHMSAFDPALVEIPQAVRAEAAIRAVEGNAALAREALGIARELTEQGDRTGLDTAMSEWLDLIAQVIDRAEAVA